jgi:hypothetical protein
VPEPQARFLLRGTPEARLVRIRRHKEGTVYRVAPGPANTWRVSLDTGTTIASFNEKSAAVRFALTLARGEAGWQLPASGASAGPGGRPVPTRHV